MWRITFFWVAALLFVNPSFTRAGEKKAGFRFDLKAKDLDSATQQKLKEFLSEAESLLPPRIKEAIARPIRVHFAALDDGTSISLPCGSDAQKDQESAKSHQHVYGSSRYSFFTSRKDARDIDLHQAFIPVILQGRQQATPYACGHHNLYDLALATLLHETAHLYDFSEYRSADEMKELDDCESNSTSLENMSTYCTRLFTRDGVVSGRLSYRQLMGWKNTLWGPAAKNKFALRSPDPYEFSDIEENFAVNMEYFLLDPEFACRRPAAHHYLSEHFGMDPFPNRACKPNYQVILSGTGILGSIDPARVYQVHYLFASQGQEMVSKWGHAMLRLVICAPERQAVDEQCLKDTEHHVIVSFRANIKDLVTDSIRGIFGGYPSQLFLYSLNEIAEEYTRKEMRDLISLPLDLSKEGKTQLVNRVAELYWGYNGQYYFMWNNCATETADLLRSVLKDSHPLQDVAIVTPLGMYEELIEEKFADNSVIANQEQARKIGYFFPSNRVSLENSFNILVQKGLRDFATLDEFFEKTNAADRRALYKRLQLPGPGKDRKLVSAFYLLESQVRRVMTKLVDDLTVGLVLDQAGGDTGSSVLSSSRGELKLNPEILALLERYKSPRLQMDPWFLVNPGAGYGAALASEMLSSVEMSARRKEFGQLIKEVYALVADRLKEENQELDAVRDNIVFFSGELRF